jgi:hypothetical protein
VTLLRRYGEHAFESRDEDYIGEVAGKLRLLVLAKQQNVPLLIKLMNDCGIEAPFTLAIDEGSPPPPPYWRKRYEPGDTVSLPEFLDLPALSVTTSSGIVTLSKQQLIEVVSQKHGAAHEDWEHPEYLTLIRESEFRIKGYAPLAAALRPITTAVLTTAEHVLPRLTPDVIAEAERRRGSQS